MTNPGKRPKKRKRWQITIPDDLYRQIQESADQGERPLTREVARLLRKALAEERKRRPPEEPGQPQS